MNLTHKDASCRQHDKPGSAKLFCKIMVTGVLLLFTVMAQGQSLTQDVIYLKGGGIYRGIIKQHAEGIIKIEIAGGSVTVITDEQVDSIQSEMVVHEDGLQFQQKKFGYYNITEIGIPIGSESQSDWFYPYQTSVKLGFSAQTVHGYRFYTHFLAGGGAGIDVVDHPMLHLFSEVRYEPLKHQTTPFIYADGGYGFDLAEEYSDEFQRTEYKGGMAWGMGLGMRVNFKTSGAFIFDAGFRSLKRSEQVFYEGSYDLLTEFTKKRLTIRMGLAF